MSKWLQAEVDATQFDGDKGLADQAKTPEFFEAKDQFDADAGTRADTANRAANELIRILKVSTEGANGSSIKLVNESLLEELTALLDKTK